MEDSLEIRKCRALSFNVGWRWRTLELVDFGRKYCKSKLAGQLIFLVIQNRRSRGLV